MLNQRFWLTLVFSAVLLLACIAGVLSVVLYIHNLPIIPPDPTRTVQAYYNALNNKNYDQAHTYFDPRGTIGFDRKGQPVSVGLIRNLDRQQALLQGYRIIKIYKSFISQNTVLVFADITRSGQNQPYEVHLFLQQEGNGWKIIYVDGL